MDNISLPLELVQEISIWIDNPRDLMYWLILIKASRYTCDICLDRCKKDNYKRCLVEGIIGEDVISTMRPVHDNGSVVGPKIVANSSICDYVNENLRKFIDNDKVFTICFKIGELGSFRQFIMRYGNHTFFGTFIMLDKIYPVQDLLIYEYGALIGKQLYKEGKETSMINLSKFKPGKGPGPSIAKTRQKWIEVDM